MPPETVEERYLDLLKMCLTRHGLTKQYQHLGIPLLDGFLRNRQLALLRTSPPGNQASREAASGKPPRLSR